MAAQDLELLAQLERSRELGLLGPGDVAEHVRHARAFVDAIPEASKVLDLGSGGGLPGLVLAVERRDVVLTLLDAQERRIAFLRDALRRLGVSERVDTVVGRAETLARRADLREAFDVVVARSFGAPAVTAECGAAFVHQGGQVLVSEPAGTGDRWPAEGLARLGLAPADVVRGDAVTIRRLVRTVAGLDEVPRADGIPTRRPLF